MNFMSATNIGKKFGFSYQKVNKILAENGLYDLVTRMPTSDAIEKGLTKTQTTLSRFNLQQVEYTAWDFNRLREIFPKSSHPIKDKKKDRGIFCRTSNDAFNIICEAFADFGDILKIENGKFIKEISEEVQNAVTDSYMSDAEYLGGSILWHRHFKPHEAATAKLKTLKFANELFEKSQKISKKRAKHNLLVIGITMQWLCDMAH